MRMSLIGQDDEASFIITPMPPNPFRSAIQGVERKPAAPIHSQTRKILRRLLTRSRCHGILCARERSGRIRGWSFGAFLRPQGIGSPSGEDPSGSHGEVASCCFSLARDGGGRLHLQTGRIRMLTPGRRGHHSRNPGRCALELASAWGYLPVRRPAWSAADPLPWWR